MRYPIAIGKIKKDTLYDTEFFPKGLELEIYSFAKNTCCVKSCRGFICDFKISKFKVIKPIN